MRHAIVIVEPKSTKPAHDHDDIQSFQKHYTENGPNCIYDTEENAKDIFGAGRTLKLLWGKDSKWIIRPEYVAFLD